MYKCTECGNLFEEGEQATWEETHGLDSPPYEKWSGCPVCKGGYEEVYQCEECGDWHSEDELYDGWCEKCLRETINYDTFFEYCEANKEEQYLDTFVMCYLLYCDEVPKYPSYEFHQLMIETYKRQVANAKLLGEKFGFLEKCVCFIMEDDGYSGIENYADWLNNRGVKQMIKKCKICGFVPKDNGTDVFQLYDGVFSISHFCRTGNNRKHFTNITIYDESKERCIEIWNKLNEEVK